MPQRGHTLIEMVVVVSIAGVLLAIALPRFSDSLTRYRSEAQTRMLFTELQQVRAQALYQRRATRVKLYRDRFCLYSTNQDEEQGVRPVAVRELPFPITLSGSWDPAKGHRIDFDVRGVAGDPRTICLEQKGLSGGVDSVVISGTRVSIGKKDGGDDCDPDNITRK